MPTTYESRVEAGNVTAARAFRYTYDSRGNITAVYDTTATPETLLAQYAYDEAGQLAREDNAQMNQTVTYTYDKGGNITEKTVYPFTTGTVGTATDTIAYTYDSTWKDKLTSYDGTTVSYDEIGNPGCYTHDRVFIWSARDLLYAYLEDGGFAEYRYNENGLRSLKIIYDENGYDVDGYYYYFWSDDGRLLAYTVDQTGSEDPYSVLVLYNSDQEPIGFTVEDDTYYYLKNIQGDVLTVTDAQGTPIVNYTYDAWGAMTVSPASQNVPSQEVVRVAFLNPITYRGYFYDYELGLYYLQSRYYDPEMGRFISADAFCDTGTGVVGTNIFAYCINNPICFYDCEGTKPKTRIAGTRFAGLYTGPKFSVNCLDSQSGQYEVKYGNALYLCIFKRYASLTYLSVYFKHNLTVVQHVVQLLLRMEDRDSRQYWKSFVNNASFDSLLITGVIEAYKMHYNCSEMSGRSPEGLLLEFYLHLYAFIFHLDPNDHTSIIDFDTPDSNGTDWWIYEYYDPTIFPFFNREKLIKDIRLSICSDSEKPVLSAILEMVLSIKKGNK